VQRNRERSQASLLLAAFHNDIPALRGLRRYCDVVRTDTTLVCGTTDSGSRLARLSREESSMRGLFFVLLITAAGTAAAQTATMYRTLAPDGTVMFSDVPLNASSQEISILVRSGTTRRAAAQQAEDDVEATDASPEDQRAAEMAANCKGAREHQQGLQNSNRLYRVLADGGREFLTDAEVAAAREQAAAEVTRWCGSG
jgi:hypothetical protein